MGKDADAYNKWFKAALFVGIFLNSLSALFNNLSTATGVKSKQFTIVALVFIFPLYVSFGVLVDAFRRFRGI